MFVALLPMFAAKIAIAFGANIVELLWTMNKFSIGACLVQMYAKSLLALRNQWKIKRE